MNDVGRTTAMTCAGVALALSVSLATPASARPSPNGGAGRIVTTGVCDAGSTWTVSGRSRFLRVVVVARVDTDTPRQRWVLRLTQNQRNVVAKSRKSTKRGVVKVKGRVRNQPGPDTFTFTARNRTTAETCQGTLTF